jgi:hypothetical protein
LPVVGVGQAISGVFTGQKESVAPCYAAFLATAGVLVIVGIPLIAVGTVKRNAYVEWRKDHPSIERVAMVPIRGGLALGWRTEF